MVDKYRIIPLREEYYGEAPRKRRRKKEWSEEKKEKITSRLQRIGYSEHEIGLWLEKKIPLGSRQGQNLIFARRRIMKDLQASPYDLPFNQAVRAADKDRIDSSLEEWESSPKSRPKGVDWETMTDEQRYELARDNIWGALYPLSPVERRITGISVRVGI